MTHPWWSILKRRDFFLFRCRLQLEVSDQESPSYTISRSFSAFNVWYFSSSIQGLGLSLRSHEHRRHFEKRLGDSILNQSKFWCLSSKSFLAHHGAYCLQPPLIKELSTRPDSWQKFLSLFCITLLNGEFLRETHRRISRISKGITQAEIVRKRWISS